MLCKFLNELYIQTFRNLYYLSIFRCTADRQDVISLTNVIIGKSSKSNQQISLMRLAWSNKVCIYVCICNHQLIKFLFAVENRRIPNVKYFKIIKTD